MHGTSDTQMPNVAINQMPEKERTLQKEYLKIYKKFQESQKLDERKEMERAPLAAKKDKAAQLLQMIKDQVLLSNWLQSLPI